MNIRMRSLVAALVLVLLGAGIGFLARPEPRIDKEASVFPRLQNHEALAARITALTGSKAEMRVYLDTINPSLCGYASVARKTIMLTETCAFPLYGQDGRYNWPAIQLLAHEIGHIIHEHASTADEKDTPQWQQDEADEFSGFVMRELGASLDEALSSLDEFDFHTHEKLSPDMKRRAVIERGWRNIRTR